MAKSIGLLELKSIPAGLETADEMLKAANVDLVLATPICPGKYIIIVSGQVGAVKSSVQAGEQIADTFLISSNIINSVHEDIPAAIAGTGEVSSVQALGAIETISALTAITAADIAAKASNIELIEIRIARGLGGKGYLLFTGEVSSVQAALQACTAQMQEAGEIISMCNIPSADESLVRTLL